MYLHQKYSLKQLLIPKSIEALNSPKNWFSDLNFIYSERRKLIWELATTLNCNFEIKKEGLAMYFRIVNEEYALVGRFNQITFQTSDHCFELQINGIAIKTEILNPKAHLAFLKNYYKYRTLEFNPTHN